MTEKTKNSINSKEWKQLYISLVFLCGGITLPCGASRLCPHGMPEDRTRRRAYPATKGLMC